MARGRKKTVKPETTKTTPEITKEESKVPPIIKGEEVDVVKEEIEIVVEETKETKESKVPPIIKGEEVDVVTKRKEKTPKESFEESISKGAYQIYQNGVLICNSSPFIKIETYEKYFQISFRKFSYTGIEVKQK